MRVRSAGAVLLATCLWAGSGGAEIYRWTDGSGREHFSNKISDVPAAQREEAARRAQSGRNRVGTVDSKPQAPVASTADATPSRLGTPAARDAESGKPLIGGDDEAGWRARATTLRADIERLEDAAEQCKESAPVRWNPGAGRRAYDDEVSEADACQRTTGDLQLARMQLEKLVENARKLGVPPGWVR